MAVIIVFILICAGIIVWGANTGVDIFEESEGSDIIQYESETDKGVEEHE